MGKLVVSMSFRYKIYSIRKRKGPQSDLRCQNFEVFVVFDAISVDFSKDSVLSSAIHSTTKKRAIQCFLEENITVFCFTNPQNDSKGVEKIFHCFCVTCVLFESFWCQNVSKRSTKTEPLFN